MIRLPVKRISSLQTMINANEEHFYTYLLRMISKAISDGEKSVVLFKFGYTPATVSTLKSEWPRLLNDAMEHFITTESYEKAGQCRKILDRLFINSI
jgi:hypothetical protein